MRPIYETEADRLRQSEIAKYVEETYNCRFIAGEPLALIDGVFVELVDDPTYEDHARLIAGAEIKVRRNASDKYPTYLLSHQKWKAGVEFSEEHGVPCLLLVKFTDGLFGTKLKLDGYPTGTGGRTDRNDPKDLELCVYIPMEQFKPL